jgi:hypothetical protein
MLLTQEQLQEVRQIIADHHNAFVANVLGPEVLAPDILDRLKQKGMLVPKFESIRDSYLYGQLLALLDDPKVATMDYDEFKRYVKGNPVSLTDIERQAIMVAQQEAGQYAVGLGNRIDQQTGMMMIEADHVLRQQLRDEIKTATAENIARRESVAQLKSDLGWATKDWARDWDRIAKTEKQNAMQYGTADSYATRYGADVRVAKRPMPDACPHCKRFYLGPDGHPRIFKLSTLMANGTNFHTKVSDWKPTVGVIHPHCQCTMIRIPPGFGFDEDGHLVPGGKGGIEYGEDLEDSIRAEDELRKSVRDLGEIYYQDLKIRVENPAGSVRHWTDLQGHKGSTKMLYPYGFIVGTEGQDGDEIDVFVGSNPKAANAFIVHQQNPKTKQYDETKCFVGFENRETVEKVYRKHYNRPDFRIWTDTMPVDAFKRWVYGTSPKTTPSPEKFLMSKSGDQITLFAVGAVSERALGAVHGTATNMLMGSPPRGLPKTDVSELTPDLRVLFRVEEPRPEVPEAMYRDLDDYTVDEQIPKIVRTFDFPESWREDFKKLRSDSVDHNHDMVTRFAKQNKPVYRNTVNPFDSEPLDFEKSQTRKSKKIVRTPVR